MTVAVRGTSCASAMSPKLSPWVTGSYARQLPHFLAENQHPLRGRPRRLLLELPAPMQVELHPAGLVGQ